MMKIKSPRRLVATMKFHVLVWLVLSMAFLRESDQFWHQRGFGEGFKEFVHDFFYPLFAVSFVGLFSLQVRQIYRRRGCLSEEFISGTLMVSWVMLFLAGVYIFEV